ALVNGSSVNGHGRDTEFKCAFKDFKELLAAFGRVVDATPHLQRHRNMYRHCIAHSSDDLQCYFRLAQVKSAAASAQHFLNGAAEIDIDHIEAAFDEAQCRWGKIL